MKRLLLVVTVAVLALPIYGPVYAQDETSIDLSGILGDRGGGGGNRGGQRGPQIPDSRETFNNIKGVLSKGKTPLENAQVKPLQSLLDSEIVALTDKIQVLRNNGGNNPEQGGGGRGGRGGQQGGTPANGQNPQQQQTAQQATIETLTSLKNDEFIDTKLQSFLSPEQVALVKKAKADDKNNSTCLGGLLDRVSTQLQNGNNRGNNNQAANRGANARTTGQKFCMTAEATPTERLEPIRKVLANGKLPLTPDKEPIAEAFMTAQIKTLEDALRSSLTGGNNPRGGGNNNNRNNPQQVIQAATDNMYKKVEAMLNPPQAETLKMWHYTEILGRGGIETLVAVEALQDTPLTDEQVAKVTAAWPELRNQYQTAAKNAGRTVNQKDIDKAAMGKILDMLDPSQVASYQIATKYGPTAGK